MPINAGEQIYDWAAGIVLAGIWLWAAVQALFLSPARHGDVRVVFNRDVRPTLLVALLATFTYGGVTNAIRVAMHF